MSRDWKSSAVFNDLIFHFFILIYIYGEKKNYATPVEKLSSDAIVEITESSSSEEESDLTPIIKPKAVKKPRSDKQLANDQRLRDRKRRRLNLLLMRWTYQLTQ